MMRLLRCLFPGLAVLAALGGCAPKISTVLNGAPLTALPTATEVLLLGLETSEPAQCILVGTVRVSEAGATVNCGLPRVLNEARQQALKMGGNVVKLTEVKPPGFASSCYQLVADVFFSPDLTATKQALQRQAQAAAKSHLPPGTNYALLYIYRPAAEVGSLVGYDVHLNDSVVYRARNNSRLVIRLSKPGPVILWAHTEATTSLNLEVEPGQEYFLRCGLEGGILLLRPQLRFVSTAQGRGEFEELPDRP